MPKLVRSHSPRPVDLNAAYAEIGRDPLHYDARLTPLGHAQVAAARETLRANVYELIVTSPFSRAIETTLGLFGPLGGADPRRGTASRAAGEQLRYRPPAAALGAGVPVPRLRPSRRYLVGTIAREGRRSPRHRAAARLRRALAGFPAWLVARPERSIAVVGHGTFFFHLTGVPFVNCGVLRWTP